MARYGIPMVKIESKVEIIQGNGKTECDRGGRKKNVADDDDDDDGDAAAYEEERRR